MQTAIFANLLVLVASQAGLYPDRPANEDCVAICQHDTGMDKESCATQCATSTDLTTHHMDEGVDSIAEDKAYNEAGGNAIEEHVEGEHPVDVLDCAPQVDIEHPPELDELDTNQNGVVEQGEAEEWGHKACVPDEMTDQIFSQADTNCDHVIDKAEYEESGPDTAQEQAVDEALEETSEGDDEYNNVQSPPLEEFDEDDSGTLDEKEHHEAVEFEMERRGEERWGTDDSEVPAQETEQAFDDVDTDDDGLIEGDEYVAPAEDGGSDLGEEITEAAHQDEDATDPDDLNQQPAAPAPAAAMLSTHTKVAQRSKAASESMLSSRFRKAQHNEAAFLKRFNIPKQKYDMMPKKRSGRIGAKKRHLGHFGRAFVELARKHKALRQKHQALRLKHNGLRQKRLRSHRRTSLRKHRAM
eukprot:gnl/MRDRNA2_/MRDRNA2_88792_c0_seq1.p1 gnl/MRDRNA2_/MRDRNA2_88792_c0~~gnl/MRDRNA2_/MRDRNA2_88792_c0_seq1.p1  ORF type:complete len:413 (-),score=128.90 gnl/MRDRNA2_/MRDRNA2_88792_c0_seq1:24-1262(-)